MNYSLQDILRMVAIVGGYLLIRPYLQKWVGRKQARDYETKENNNILIENQNTIIENEEEKALIWGITYRGMQKKEIT